MRQLGPLQSKVVGVIIDEWHTAREIAQVLDHSTPSVAGALHRLKNTGLVERFEDDGIYWYRVDGSWNPSADKCTTCNGEKQTRADYYIGRHGVKHGVCVDCAALYERFMPKEKIRRAA